MWLRRRLWRTAADLCALLVATPLRHCNVSLRVPSTGLVVLYTQIHMLRWVSAPYLQPRLKNCLMAGIRMGATRDEGPLGDMGFVKMALCT